jgi:rhodanese-related sulfurtransferase
MFVTKIDTQNQTKMDLFPSEALSLISKNEENDGFAIIDVSTPQEFAERHLENATNISYLSRGFKFRLNALDKDGTYLVYCKVGGRSKLAQRVMKKLGFSNVYNLVGGTLLWEEEDLPFAAGGQSAGFTFCPIFISIVTYKKMKKLLS